MNMPPSEQRFLKVKAHRVAIWRTRLCRPLHTYKHHVPTKKTTQITTFLKMLRRPLPPQSGQTRLPITAIRADTKGNTVAG